MSLSLSYTHTHFYSLYSRRVHFHTHTYHPSHLSLNKNKDHNSIIFLHFLSISPFFNPKYSLNQEKMSSKLCFSSYSNFYYNFLLHDLVLFFSFILSHPLYFSYFIFFSPYLLKLLSFLSPLFITTSLLLLPFIHHNATFKFSDHKQGFFLSTFLMITEKIRAKIDAENEEVGSFEEFEVYKIVFDHTNYSTFDEIRELPIEVVDTNADEECVTKVCTHEVSSMISTATATAVQEERKSENFLELLDRFEKMANGNVEDKKVDHQPPCPKSNKVARELQKEDLQRGSEATVIKIRDNDCTFKARGADNGREYTTSGVTSNVHPKKIDENVKDINNSWECTSNSDSTRSFDSSLGSYGSMRKEREWKRTLACKLFEERHNGGGEEGMDLLWETHETDSGKAMTKKKGEAKLRKNDGKKNGINEFYYDPVDEEDDEDLPNGQICCLQALKLSSGKMNFGMGKPNLVKISKALKGIGWLHHVSRHGKKVTPRT